MAKILVAGSDLSETQARALVLEFAGHECATAASVGEAVEVLKRDRSFSVIVADPKLRGGEAADISRKLRIASSLKPTLLVLASGSEVSVQADETLSIPCTPQDFDRAVRRALVRFQARRKRISSLARKPAASLSRKKRAKCA